MTERRTKSRGAPEKNNSTRDVSATSDPEQRVLPAAARRALAEAEERRARSTPDRPREIAGRGGEDPVRYGDWEIKGLAVDF